MPPIPNASMVREQVRHDAALVASFDFGATGMCSPRALTFTCTSAICPAESRPIRMSEPIDTACTTASSACTAYSAQTALHALSPLQASGYGGAFEHAT